MAKSSPKCFAMRRVSRYFNGFEADDFAEKCSVFNETESFLSALPAFFYRQQRIEIVA
jgi:hypothetical protein